MKGFRRIYLVLVMLLCLLFGSLPVQASDIGTLTGGSTTTEVTQPATTSTTETTKGSIDFTDTGDDSADALINGISGQQNFTDESMAKANKLAAPGLFFLNLINSLLIIVIIASIGTITLCDLAFIAIPLIRPLMYPMYTQMMHGGGHQQGGGMMSPMGGGIGGFGRGYGMGGMMVGGQQQQSFEPTKHYQLVSDEAVQAIGLAQPMQAQQQQGVGMGGMMGMGMQQPQPQAQALQGKSVIWAYLKKRAVFLVVFSFAAVFLTASVVTGFGLKTASFAIEAIASWL